MKKKFWIVNQVNATTAEILLYGFIGEYEAIDDAAFITDLRTLENSYTTINMRVNCGGGDVYKGLAIFNAIQNSKAHINGFVDGIAASMGAVVIAACKTVQMSQYSRYMTHRVSGYMGGNADDMRNFADQLEQLEITIATIISKRTGLTVDEAKSKYITNQDRWIGADQALTEKLIDGIYDANPVDVPANESNPQQLFNAYHKVFNISSNNQLEMKSIALLLGLPENATEAEINAAVTKLKNEKETAENAMRQNIKARAKALVDRSITNKQLVEADRAVFEPLAESNYEAAEAAINKIPFTKKPTQMIVGTPVINGVEELGGDVTTWEELGKKDDAFIAAFKKENGAAYNSMLETYLKKDK